LKVYTTIGKKKTWFVKLDEDAMPRFDELKDKLCQLSDFAHEKLAGHHDFFLRQIDSTYEYHGFFYAKNVKNLVKQLK
jgi:hypothetical protein